MFNADEVIKKLAQIRIPFMFKSKAMDAISDAMILLKKQEQKIQELESVIANQK